MQQSRALVSLDEPDSEYLQSKYAMHPACIDGCMQTAAPSLWRGRRSNVSAVLVPAIIDSLIINSTTTHPGKGTSISSSKYVGRGRREETKNYMSEVTVYDTDTGSTLLQMTGLRYHKLDTREDLHSAHNYSQVIWKPDITWLTQDKFLGLLSGELGCKTWAMYDQPVDRILGLVAHKKPSLKVMEVNMIAGDSSSVWLDNLSTSTSSRASRDQCSYVTNDAAALIEAQEKYGAQPKTEFTMIDFTKSQNDVAASTEAEFDLVIVHYVSRSLHMGTL